MIELFDASRLTVRRDHTLATAGMGLLVTAGIIAAYSAFVQFQLRGAQTRSLDLQSKLQALDQPGSRKGSTTPRAALVADLQRKAEQLEALERLQREASGSAAERLGKGMPGADPEADGSAGSLTPVQWMEHLQSLTRPDTSLQKVDIERDGVARVEGLATSAQSLNALIQTWQQKDALTHLPPRTIEVRQEKQPGALLRFQLRAAPNPRAMPATPANAPAERAAP